MFLSRRDDTNASSLATKDINKHTMNTNYTHLLKITQYYHTNVTGTAKIYMADTTCKRMKTRNRISGKKQPKKYML